METHPISDSLGPDCRGGSGRYQRNWRVNYVQDTQNQSTCCLIAVAVPAATPCLGKQKILVFTAE